MEPMQIAVLAIVGVLVIFVAVITTLGVWMIIRVSKIAVPIQEMIDKQTRLIDKLVTLVVSKGPMEYSSIRAADSFLGYDEDTSSAEPTEGINYGEGQFDGDDGWNEEEPFFDDPVIEGTFN